MKQILFTAIAIFMCASILTGCTFIPTRDIEDTFINELGELVIIYSDGSEKNLGVIKGEEGDRGPQGEKGNDGIVPLLRINSETNEWEISTDNSETWISIGIKATGDNGLSAYELYKKYHPDYEGTEEEWIDEFFKEKEETSKVTYGIYKVTKPSYSESFVFIDESNIYAYTTEKTAVTMDDYTTIVASNYSPAYGYANMAFFGPTEYVVKFSYEIVASGVMKLDDGSLVEYGSNWYKNNQMKGTLLTTFEE